MPRKIVIEYHGPLDIDSIEVNPRVGFSITAGDRSTHDLAWDEMLGQLISLTFPPLNRAPLFPFLTDEQHAAEEARRQERIARSRRERGLT